jgi:hypothetical protein
MCRIWNSCLKTPANKLWASTTTRRGSPTAPKKAVSAASATVRASISPCDRKVAMAKPVMQSMNVRTLTLPYLSGICPGTKCFKYTTSNGTSQLRVWSSDCCSCDVAFARLQWAHPRTPSVTSRTTPGHQKLVCTRKSVRVIPEWPANGELWHAEMTTRRRLDGTTLVRSCRSRAAGDRS